MSRFFKLFKYELKNVGRNKWIFAYGILLAVFGGSLIWVGGSFNKAILSIANLIVVLVPLISLMFTTVYWYYNERYAHLLLTQPISRFEFFCARLLALALSLGVSAFIGLALPFAILGNLGFGVWLNSLVALAFTLLFVTLGMLIATGTTDRMKGVGIAMGLWIFSVLVYDGIVLLLLLALREYPLDIPAALASAINPIGLGRVVLLMYHEGALLLGYTGTMVRRLMTSHSGFWLASAIGLVWMTIPLGITWRRFRKKDF